MKDMSKISKCTYLLGHILVGYAVSYFMYLFVPIVSIVKNSTTSLVQLLVCTVLCNLVGLALTYQKYRKVSGIFFDAFSGAALYLVCSMDFIPSAIRIFVIIMAVITIVGLLLRILCTVAELKRKKRKAQRWMYPILLLLRRNLGIVAIFIALFVPFSVSYANKHPDTSGVYSDNGYASKYDEGDYAVNCLFGEECKLENNIDRIRLIRDNATWMNLDESRKKDVIRAICYCEAAYLGLNCRLKLVFVDSLSESVRAEYSNATNTIYYSIQTLNDSNEKAFCAIAHEVFHAYQHQIADIYVKQLTPDQRNLIAFYDYDKWVKNFENYVDGETDYEAYWEQPIEKDARRYAEQSWNQYKEQMNAIFKDKEGS